MGEACAVPTSVGLFLLVCTEGGVGLSVGDGAVMARARRGSWCGVASALLMACAALGSCAGWWWCRAAGGGGGWQ
jgi:hypothetical protein